MDFAIRQPSDPQNTSFSEDPCGETRLGNIGPSLFLGLFGGENLSWAAALAADSYKVRRSPHPDFMHTHPIPDDTWLLEQLAETSTEDPSLPDPGTALYYFVNAVADDGGESPD